MPDSSAEKALLRSSVVVMVELSNSLVTAQALLEDTCAAILVEAEFAGTVELED